MTLPIYILTRTPGVDACTPGVREWTEICRESHVSIRHSDLRPTGRWSYATRKRPFIVQVWFHRGSGSSIDVSSSATLAGALKAARRAATDYA